MLLSFLRPCQETMEFTSVEKMSCNFSFKLNFKPIISLKRLVIVGIIFNIQVRINQNLSRLSLEIAQNFPILLFLYTKCVL